MQLYNTEILRIVKMAVLIPVVLLSACERTPVENLSESADAVLVAPTYETIEGWAKLPEGLIWASNSAITVDQSDHIWIADRCGANSCATSDLNPVMEFDTDGNMLKSFGAGLLSWPHGIYADTDGNIWVADGRSEAGKGHQVIKFDTDGNVLMRLGQPGVPGDEPGLLNTPSDIVIADDGTIFVADGHGADSNDRVVKYASDGTFLMAWGGPGSEQGQFKTIHSISIDEDGQVLVADRDNGRVQIFDQNGNYITEWSGLGPMGLGMGADGVVYVAGSDPEQEGVQGIWVVRTEDGAIQNFIPGTPNPNGEGLLGAEDIAVDSKGNLYGAKRGGPIKILLSH